MKNIINLVLLNLILFNSYSYAQIPKHAIADPCNCTSLDNIYDSNGDLLYLYETVWITAAPSQSWQMVNPTTGVVDAAGNPATLPLNMTETFTTSGTYEIHFYHLPNVGYAASFTDGSVSMSVANNCTNCGAAAPSVIPTLSEWGLILLSILLLSAGIVAIRQQSMVVIGPAGQKVKTRLGLMFDAPSYLRALGVSFGLAALAVVLSYVMTSEMKLDDWIGGAICLPVLAYLIHLVWRKG